MKFVDWTKIYLESGKGGAGCASMRREKFVEFGGPDGGDGGRGGSVIFLGDETLATLQDLRLHRHQRAKCGKSGMGSQRAGKSGEDCIIRVPFGTIITDVETKEVLLEVLDEKPTTILKGGKGGLGNQHFKTSTNRAPRYAQPGEPGEDLEVELELRLMADVGLVGFPNAGKSTFISSVSSARPKIADYPFTTLVPNLGVVAIQGFRSFVIADIPGIIEKASEGVGLGDQFLKHIQRTSVLAFLIDGSDFAEKPPMETYQILLNELKSFSPDLVEKERVVLLTKLDAKTDHDDIPDLIEEFKEIGEELLPISSVTKKGVDNVIYRLYETVEKDREQRLEAEKAAKKTTNQTSMGEGVDKTIV